MDLLMILLLLLILEKSINLNLELGINNNCEPPNHIAENDNGWKRQHFGRIIFHTEDVDRLYSYFKNNDSISNLISFENEPTNAAWGERYFHIREPDGYQLSFAEPIAGSKGCIN